MTHREVEKMDFSVSELWAKFIYGFCKVEFLCYAGEPNWLGWAVMVVGVYYVLRTLSSMWQRAGDRRR